MSPIAPLAKFLANFLIPILKDNPTTTSITSIPKFIENIHNLPPSPNSTMISFDVVNMYPSLPHHLIIDNTIEFLALNNIPPDISSKIISLVKLSLQYNIFSFNSNFYRQAKGSSMGSPLSSPLAEIRCIDDIFCVSNSNKIDSIFTQLKSIHNDIDFTIETENNNTLPFLDVLILKTQNQYTTEIYHKPNSTPDYIHFSSYSPLSHKINTVKTLSKRIYTHCSTQLSKDTETQFLINKLTSNGYLKNYIKTLL
ncbi:hypothetical protein LAZ67_7000503 [Cordylochernes scorpioides]|uniref:Helix-turn-helix domain-containing protein n=1 Tax=Cordylochernes scorpioides TaxID=51811 RepID=A0ABY6KMJ0_9ARAC|nr:hypothetical protein LAZ67_7000503 [Cordylochernes scorpioides]